MEDKLSIYANNLGIMNTEEKAEQLYWDFNANKDNAIRCVDEIISLHKKVALNTLEFYVDVKKKLENYA